MRRFFTLGLAASSVVALALSGGCIQTKQAFTLNPDGSGKVVHEITMPLDTPGAPIPNDKQTPQDKAAAAVKSILTESEGIDAWTDASYEITKEGKLHFTGTALFANINALKIGGGSGGDMSGFEATVTRTEGGGFVVKLEEEDNPAGKVDPNLTDAQIAAQIAEARAQYTQSKPMMSAMLTGLRKETTYTFPGAIKSATNFTKVDAHTVRLVLEGEKMMKAMDEVINDDALLKAGAREGRNIAEDGPDKAVFNQKLFGTKGPVTAEAAGGGEAAFDYAAAVAAAKEAAPAMWAKLGITPPATSVTHAPATGQFKALRVIGVRYIAESDNDRGIRPFNDEAGYAIALLAELDGAALEAEGGQVTAATSDDGTDLLPEREFDREVHFPNLTEDKTAIVFEVKLSKPPADAKGLSGVAGTMSYMTAGDAKAVELGAMAMKAGSKGAALGAEITKVERSQFQDDATEIELKLEVDPAAVKEVRFTDAAGNAVEVSRSGYFGGGGEVTLSFIREGKVPPTAKVTVEVYDQMTKHTVNWKLGPMNLLGQAVK